MSNNSNMYLIRNQNIPLVYRMSARLNSMPKRDFESVRRRAINKLRRFSGESIAKVALEVLWNPPVGLGQDVRSAPWLTLLLVKWAMQDKQVYLEVGPSISMEEFNGIRQELWSLQGAVQAEVSNVWIMIRNLIYVQMEFQRAESWNFLRWPALYARLENNSKNRKHFRDVIGMEPEPFLDLSYCLYAAVLNRKMPLGRDYLSPLRTVYGADVDKIYDLFYRDLNDLRRNLQMGDGQRINGKQELFEFPYLKWYPFLRLKDGRVNCWHPLVFSRGLEDAVHIRLSNLGAEYVNEFSRVYEKYVTELAVECGQPMLDETSYKKKVGGHSPAVEVIFEGEDCNIFVEAKMSLFADDVLLQDNEKILFQKTKRLREAIKQGWRVGEIIRDPVNGFGDRFNSKEDYLLIVTSRELNIGNGEKLRQLFPTEDLNYPDEKAKARLPFSNIFILSIEEFERTIGCIASGEINLSKVLKCAVESNKSADKARMYFSDFISEYAKKWVYPRVMNEARQCAEERVRAAMKGT